MSAVPPRKAPTIRLRRLAAELKRLRVEAGLTQEEAAAHTGFDPSSLYRIERAMNKPQRRTVITLMNLYGVTDPARRETLMSWLKESVQQGWVQIYEPYLPELYQTYIQFEYDAERLRNYESLFLPGLLQTEDYARAVIKGIAPDLSADDVKARVDVRMRRQTVLTRPTTPLQLIAVVDEAAIRRVVGGTAIMRAQLEHLLEAAEAPNVTVQVVPFSAGAHPGMPGSFVVMEFAAQVDPPLVYSDSMVGDAFLEAEEDVARFNTAFEQIMKKALSQTKSLSMIRTAAAEA